jgi:hypothetical protein
VSVVIIAPQSRNRTLKALGHAPHMPAEHDDAERLLDAALEQTFPASDPIAVDVTPRNEAPPILKNRCFGLMLG